MEEDKLHISNFPYWMNSSQIEWCIAERFPWPTKVTPLKRGAAAPWRRQSAFVHWARGQGPYAHQVSGWLPYCMWAEGWTVPLVAADVRPPPAVSWLQKFWLNVLLSMLGNTWHLLCLCPNLIHAFICLGFIFKAI